MVIWPVSLLYELLDYESDIQFDTNVFNFQIKR